MRAARVGLSEDCCVPANSSGPRRWSSLINPLYSLATSPLVEDVRDVDGRLDIVRASSSNTVTPLFMVAHRAPQHVAVMGPLVPLAGRVGVSAQDDSVLPRQRRAGASSDKTRSRSTRQRLQLGFDDVGDSFSVVADRRDVDELGAARSKSV